jgi:hypothetical protein
MPYIHKFTKELEQFGLCSYRLTLTDSDSILPELNIPVVLKQEENTEEAMLQLAARVIAQQTPTPVEITEEILIVEESITQETSLEEQI